MSGVSLRDPAALAGQYRVRPGQRPSIVGGRPSLAAALLRGQPVAAAAPRLSALFALCGRAHRLCAELAVGAAGAANTAKCDDVAHADALARETLTEHLRRIWIDWPVRLASAAPRVLPDAQTAGAPEWVERHVLGMPAIKWLEHWEDDPRGCLARWSVQAATFPARLLADCRAVADAMRAVPQPLVIDETRLGELALQIAAAPAFAHAPRQRGLPAETGTWTRSGDRRILDYDTAWLRLGARVAEVARLSAGDGAAAFGLRFGLHFGAQSWAPGEALGWCEMARGILLHWVRVDPDDAARIADYRVIAPTEWNFHPDGTLAQALSRLDAAPDDGALASQVGAWMGAFDPCIAYVVDTDGARTNPRGILGRNDGHA